MTDYEKGVQDCIDYLMSEHYRQLQRWKDYIWSGHGGPATSYDEIPKAYAERIKEKFIK